MSQALIASPSQPIDARIDELDAIYQEIADCLERQARDAQLIDKALRKLLDQAPSEAPVLEWDPRHPISPRNAFRALAMQIVASVTTPSGHRSVLTPVDYEDLLVWTDEPARTGDSLTEDFLRSIGYARRHTLRTFWDKLQLRISPQHDPERALQQATEDLIAAFAVEQPANLVVPVIHHNPQRSLRMGLQRADGELLWMLSPIQVQRLTRANHGIATVCRLDGRHDLAEDIHEATARITQRLRASFAQYAPNDHFHAGTQMQLRFGRDAIAYQLRRELFERIAEHLSTHSAGLEFVPAHEA